MFVNARNLMKFVTWKWLQPRKTP